MPLLVHTPRLLIREFRRDEKQLFLSIFDDVQVMRHLPKRRKKELSELFQLSFIDYAAGSPFGRWGIYHLPDGDFIGFCLLRPYGEEKRRIELGYVLRQKYWGQGMGTEIAAIMIARGFSETAAEEIVALTTLDNIASQRVLLKNGMMRTENCLRDGKQLAFFSITRRA